MSDYINYAINHDYLWTSWCWRRRSWRYPTLNVLAKKHLAILATSVPAERAFSTAGNIVNQKRALPPFTKCKHIPCRKLAITLYCVCCMHTCCSLLPFLSSTSVVVVNKWPCGAINLSWTCAVRLFYFLQIVKRGAESERWGWKLTAHWLNADCNTENLKWADQDTTVTLLAMCWKILAHP